MNDDDIKRIIEMRGQNIGYRTIAAKLGLSRDAVKQYCKKHDLAGNRGGITTQEKWVLIISDFDGGADISELAKKYSMAEQSIQHGLYKRGKTALRRRNEALQVDLMGGMSWQECADKYGLKKDTVRVLSAQLCVHDSTTRKREQKERATQILHLRNEGKSYTEIAKLCGCSVMTVGNYCRDAGLGGTPCNEYNEHEIKLMYLQGMSCRDIGNVYGISHNTVRRVIQNIATPEERHKRKNDQTYRTKDAEKKYITMLLEHGYKNPRHIIGNYGGWYVAECGKCGAELKIAKRTLQHIFADGRKIKCRECEPAEQKYSNQLIREAKLLENATRKHFRHCDKQIGKIIKKTVQDEKARLAKQAKQHPCLVCGEMTTNPKYCSEQCQKKAMWARKDASRRSKIINATVDKDISLQGLYERDHGVCHICGEKCDWSDHKEINGVFLVGYNYPSIDHVMPLAKGGEHSWDNVKLAHWYCNSLKSDTISA